MKTNSVEVGQKVFILTCQSSVDYDAGLWVKAYKAKKAALEEMRRQYHNEVNESYDKDGTWNIKSISNTTAQIYEYGDWTRNHIEWEIHEQTIE